MNVNPVLQGTKFDIEYIPGPAATKFHLSPARVKAAWGPVRSGKSTALVWRVFFKAKEAAAAGIGLRALLLRDSFRNLEDTTVKTFTEWLAPLGQFQRRQGVLDFVFDLDGKRHEVLFRHGQTAQDASSFLSSEYGFIGLEEVAPAFSPTGLISPGIAEEVFDIALTRLVQRGMNNPELAISCNPPTPQHWVNKRIISKSPEELKALGWWHFFFGTSENEGNLRAGYYDELRRSLKGKDHLLKRFVEGEIVAIYPGMPVFSGNFKQTIHVRDRLEPVEGSPIVFGYDAGLTPACVWTQIDAYGRWLVLYELQGGYVDDRLNEQVGTYDFADMIRAETATRFPGIRPGVMYADPAVNQKQPGDMKTVRKMLEEKGFVVEPGEVDIPARVEAIRNRLTTMVGGEPAMLISRSGCPLLIEAVSGGYRYGVSRDGTRVHGAEPIKDHYSHVADALGYPASKLFPVGDFSMLGDREPEVERHWRVFETHGEAR